MIGIRLYFVLTQLCVQVSFRAHPTEEWVTISTTYYEIDPKEGLEEISRSVISALEDADAVTSGDVSYFSYG